MDPSAPPVGWTDEKSPMSQPLPPPYNEYHGPGYSHAGPGYPQPGPGYPQPGPGYPPQPQGDMGPPPYGNAAYGQQPYPMGQQYSGQPAITAQPKVYVTPVVLASPVEDYLCYSIFTTLCCCMPLGIAALIYSISTREANNMGDRLRAEQSSKTARTLNHVALGLGIGIIILLIAFIVVSFVFM